MSFSSWFTLHVFFFRLTLLQVTHVYILFSQYTENLVKYTKWYAIYSNAILSFWKCISKNFLLIFQIALIIHHPLWNKILSIPHCIARQELTKYELLTIINSLLVFWHTMKGLKEGTEHLEHKTSFITKLLNPITAYDPNFLYSYTV